KKSDDAGVRAAAKEFIQLLAEGDFGKAAAALDAGFAGRMNADKLRQTWQGLVVRLGTFRGQGEPELQRRPTGDAAYVTCSFGDRKVIARILLDEQQQISNLVFVQPPLTGPGLIRASYADRIYAAQEGAVGTVTLPIPGTFRGQVPLAFTLRV